VRNGAQLTSNLCSSLFVVTQGSLTPLVLRDTAMLTLLAVARDSTPCGLVWCGLRGACEVVCVRGVMSSDIVRREGRLWGRKVEGSGEGRRGGRVVR
jgi:hypothetical protein